MHIHVALPNGCKGTNIRFSSSKCKKIESVQCLLQTRGYAHCKEFASVQCLLVTVITRDNATWLQRDQHKKCNEIVSVHCTVFSAQMRTLITHDNVKWLQWLCSELYKSQ